MSDSDMTSRERERLARQAARLRGSRVVPSFIAAVACVKVDAARLPSRLEAATAIMRGDAATVASAVVALPSVALDPRLALTQGPAFDGESFARVTPRILGAFDKPGVSTADRRAGRYAHQTLREARRDMRALDASMEAPAIAAREAVAAGDSAAVAGAFADMAPMLHAHDAAHDRAVDANSVVQSAMRGAKPQRGSMPVKAVTINRESFAVGSLGHGFADARVPAYAPVALATRQTREVSHNMGAQAVVAFLRAFSA